MTRDKVIQTLINQVEEIEVIDSDLSKYEELEGIRDWIKDQWSDLSNADEWAKGHTIELYFIEGCIEIEIMLHKEGTEEPTDELIGILFWNQISDSELKGLYKLSR